MAHPESMECQAATENAAAWDDLVDFVVDQLVEIRLSEVESEEQDHEQND